MTLPNLTKTYQNSILAWFCLKIPFNQSFVFVFCLGRILSWSLFLRHHHHQELQHPTVITFILRFTLVRDARAPTTDPNQIHCQSSHSVIQSVSQWPKQSKPWSCCHLFQHIISFCLHYYLVNISIFTFYRLVSASWEVSNCIFCVHYWLALCSSLTLPIWQNSFPPTTSNPLFRPFPAQLFR